MVESCPSCGGALAPGSDRSACACELEPAPTLPSASVPVAKGGTSADARALRCPACGGWLESTHRKCTYCSVELATVRCWRCFALSFAGSSHCGACGAALGLEGDLGETDEPCPACEGEKLHFVAVGDHRIRECMGCGGVLLDHETLERLTRARELEAGVRVLDGGPLVQRELKSLEFRYRSCPTCRTILTRRNFGQRSGVIVDVCKLHGVFFDADELTAVLEFAASGGLRRERERERSEAKIELTRRRAEALTEQAVTTGVSGEIRRGSWAAESAGALLAAIVDIFSD